MKDSERPKNDQELQRRNIEYVAEVIGSLIGTIRSGVRIFVENLRQRPGRQEMMHESVMKEDLKESTDNYELERSGSLFLCVIICNNLNLILKTFRTIKNITLDEKSSKTQNDSINLPTSSINFPDNQTKHETGEASTEVIDDPTKIEVKLLRKQKRSQKLPETHPEGKIANYFESSNEPPLFPQPNHAEKLINVESDREGSLQNLPNEKHKRIIKAFLAPLITAPVSQASLKSLNQKILHFNSLISEISSEIDSQAENGTSLESFKLLNQVGNSTIRARTRLALQQAFYRYARLFLIARKGFKDAGSAVLASNLGNNRKMPQILENFSIMKSAQRRHIIDLNSKSNEVNFEGDSAVESNDEFATNGGKASFETGQAFAILVLEVFGAIFGLTIGLIAQIQAGVMG